MNFNGWIDEAVFLTADLEKLITAELVRRDEPREGYVSWDWAGPETDFDGRLNELELEEPRKVKSILKTSHEIIIAAVEGDQHELLESFQQYFFLAFKKFRNSYFDGHLPPELARLEPREHLHDFIVSISRKKYGNWEGFLQHAVDENWNDGRFIGYFQQYLKSLLAKTAPTDPEYNRRKLARSVGRILDNETRFEWNFVRQNAGGEDYYCPECWDTKIFPDASENSLDFERLAEELPVSLFSRKKSQETSQFQLDVPDLKPLIKKIFASAEVPLKKETIVDYLAHRFGISDYHVESRQELPSNKPAGGANPEKNLLLSEKKNEARQKFKDKLAATLEKINRSIAEIKRNKSGQLRAYAAENQPAKVDRGNLEQRKARAELFLGVYCLYKWRSQGTETLALIPGLELQTLTDTQDYLAVLREIMGFGRSKSYQFKNRIENYFGFDLLDSAEPEVVEWIGDNFLAVLNEYDFPHKFLQKEK